MPTFTAETVAAVLHHMNDDHLDDNLLIARAFGSPDATAATMTTLDHLGGTWAYTAGEDEHTVVVAWHAPISERQEIRREIVVLYDRACELLGLEPRPHE